VVDSLQNRSSGGAEGIWIAEQARTPIGSHGKRLNFECQLAYIHVLSDFAGGLSVPRCLFQMSKPLHHQLHDSIANASGAIVEFKRCGRKEAASGKNPRLAIRQPILTKRSQTIHSSELECGADYRVDEDIASFIDHSTLQVFLGSEVGEQAAFADSQRGS
jgi:hypothetical protein